MPGSSSIAQLRSCGYSAASLNVVPAPMACPPTAGRSRPRPRITPARSAAWSALCVSRELANKREIAWNLGALAMNQVRHGGDLGNVRQVLEESIAFGRESGDLTPVLYSMALLARIYAGRDETSLSNTRPKSTGAARARASSNSWRARW